MQNEFQEVSQGRIPAPQTLKFINDTQILMNNLKNEISNLSEALKKSSDSQEKFNEENKRQHQRIFDKIDEWIECSDKKYADREQFNFWRNFLIGGLFLTILITVLKMLIK